MIQIRDYPCPDFSAYVLTDEGIDLATRTARQGGWDPAHVHRGGLAGAGRLTFDRPLATRMIAELGNEELDQACDSVTAVARSGAQLVVIGKSDDLATYRAFKTAGAADYFAFPAETGDLLGALDPQIVHLPAKATTAMIVGVVGCSGGVGASMLTQNLAQIASAGRDAARVALVDADLGFASLAHDLNQEPTVGIRDALSDPGRVDRLFLDASMTQVRDGFWLYSCCARDGAEAQRLQGNLPGLLHHMAPHFDVIFVDISRATLLFRPELAAALDKLIMVLTPGYAGLSGYIRLFKSCHATSPALTTIPVLSQIRSDARLSMQDIGQAIGRKPAVTLPDQHRGMVQAQQLGRPLVDVMRKSPYAQQVGKLWEQIKPGERQKTRAFWPSLMRRLGR